MKRFFLFSLLALLLIMIGACSKPTDESGELANTSREEDNNIEDKNQSYSHNPSSTEKAEKNQTSTSNESESVSKKHDDHPTTNGEEHPVKDFDVEHYLNEHYPIDHTYYTTDTWENEDTGKTEYIIGIQPDTEEFGQEIDDIFKNGSPEFDDERTINMMDIAEDIIEELPQLNDQIHIESVYWQASDEEEFPILLVQDR